MYGTDGYLLVRR